MKSLIAGLLLALCLIQAVHGDTEAEKTAKFTACGSENKLTPAEIKLVSEDRMFAKMTAAPSKNLQCYMLCVYKKFNLVGADNKPNIDEITKYMSQTIKDDAKVKKAVDECRNVKGAEMCETIYNLEKCIEEHSGA